MELCVEWRMWAIGVLCGFLVFLVGCAAQAFAETVNGSISGTVTSIETSGDGHVPDSVTVGDAVDLVFSYEGDTPGSGNSVYAEYGVDINLTLAASIDGLVWEVITPGRWDMPSVITVQNDAAGGDRLTMSSSTIIGGHVGSSFPTSMGGACEVSFQLYDETAPFDFISSLALPTSLDGLEPDAVTRTLGWIAADSASGHSSIHFELDPQTLELQAVPEPSSLALALLGLLGLGFARRRWKRNGRA